jgi:octaprenyl-diphosphate synthase
MSAIDALKYRLAAKADAVLRNMQALASGRAELIPLISDYLISSGGKRIRPLLTLASAELCGYRGEADVALAAAVELIHTATLLHDDVVDGSAMRRGKSAANLVWGNKESILVGDFLLSQAFKLMGRAGSLEVYRILSEAAVVITEGEVMQLEAQHRGGLTETEYFDVIRAKTAALFAAACASGGAAASRGEEEVSALHDYGMHLGVAFQIADDAMDYYYAEDVTGKRQGDDFRERKITLPVLYLRKSAAPERVARLDAHFAGQEGLTPEEAASWMRESGVGRDVRATAEIYAKKAASALAPFPEGPVKTLLLALADEMPERCS